MKEYDYIEILNSAKQYNELYDLLYAIVIDGIPYNIVIEDYADANELYDEVPDIDRAYEEYKDRKLMGDD